MRRSFWVLGWLRRRTGTIFDRKHPADLNRGFGRQEEPRRNGSHLVCLSESEKEAAAAAAAGAAAKLHRTRAPLPFPAPSPTLFPSPGHPARPTPGGEQGKTDGRPLLLLQLPPPPPPIPAVLPSGEPDSGAGREGEEDRGTARAPGRSRAASSELRDGSAARPGSLGRDPRRLGPHRLLLANKWSRSVSRPEEPLLGGSLGERGKAWAAEGEEEV